MPRFLFSEAGEPTVVSTAFHEVAQAVLSADVTQSYTQWFHGMLLTIGVPKPHPTADQIALMSLASLAAAFLYFIFVGRSHRTERLKLVGSVDELRRQLAKAEAKLVDFDHTPLSSAAGGGKGGRKVRIWMDGAFDMMHYGHMNAFRQGAALGTELVVGINSDESITQCKGPPVMNDEERIASVASCKFVKEVVQRVPYVMDKDYIEKVVFGQYGCDYIVHGDDPCIVDGKDVFASAKAAGKYREIPRTEGVSTTDIVGRMLLVTKSHHTADHFDESTEPRQRTVSFDAAEHDGDDGGFGGGGGGGGGALASGAMSEAKRADGAAAQQQNRSSFLATNLLLQLFGAGTKPPAADARVVYLDGAWDMFHSGHALTLRKAKEMGDYVIVGVHSDTTVNHSRGANYPILNMHERVLSVLGCKYVDDVLLDAPWTISREMIKSLNISVVAHGTCVQPADAQHHSPTGRNAVPIELGLFQSIDSDSALTVGGIVDRIKSQEERFKQKFAKKMAKENAYYAERYGDEGGEEGEEEPKKKK
jgi:ethanolamine-phosphate cytidylyltransferase